MTARQTPDDASGESVTFPAADGYSLSGRLYRHLETSPASSRPVIVINPATSVLSRFYARFAEYLHADGFDVLTYDYRGIGDSKHGDLRHLEADWLDWGANDCEGALRFVLRLCPGRPVHVVAHSFGGLAIGLAESAAQVASILSVGAQFAYWRDYAPAHRRTMWFKWHVLMPIIAKTCGYVPGKRLGWMEDTPHGVAADWWRMGPAFEHSLRPSRALPVGIVDRDGLRDRPAAVRAPILAIAFEDDPFATHPAVDRLLGYFCQSPRHHLRFTPSDLGHVAIGHFAFFSKRYAESLWPLALDWLRDRTVPTLNGGSKLPLQTHT